MLKSSISRLLPCFALALAANSHADVIISEIMYHPQSENSQEEYIELHNTDAINPANVSGWQFTSGITFTLPNTSIPAGGYLVIAADGAAFTAKYPAFSGAMFGGWAGTLSNSANRIVLKDAAGATRDEVRYADDGDWATRREDEPPISTYRGWHWHSEADGQGKSLELVNVAMDNSKGQNWGDSSVVGGTPGAANSIAATDIAPLISDVEHYPLVPTSTQAVTVNIKLADELSAGLTATLFFRLDGAPTFSAATMFDDGAHSDGLAGDGRWGAQIPAQANGSIVEFYVVATDAAANARTWPKPALDWSTGTSSYSAAQVTNCLYQVDNTAYVGAMPIYRIVVKAADFATLQAINNASSSSNAQFNGTFITRDGTGTELRYLCGIRNRGHFSEGLDPQNFRVNVPTDTDWKGLSSLNLNGQFPYAQLLGSSFMRRVGLAAPDSRAVQLRINNNNLASTGSRANGFYACNEVYNSDFADHHFPQDSGGNIYSVRRTDSGPYQEGFFDYRTPAGVNGGDPYRTTYFKETNGSEDDWSDLIALTQAIAKGQSTTLAATPTWDADYVSAIESKIDVRQWLRWFAAEALMSNEETNISRGYGDDFYFYTGALDVRAKLIPHDLDSVFGLDDGSPTPSDMSIFRPVAYESGNFSANTPSPLYPFFRHPDFARTYFAQLKSLLEGEASVANFNQLCDQALTGLVNTTLINERKAWYLARHTFVAGLINQPLAVTTAPAIVSGYPQSTSGTATLGGTANPVRTHSVKVNGVAATYVPWKIGGTTVASAQVGRWDLAGVTLTPGINRIYVQSFDKDDVEFENTSFDVWYDDGSTTSVTGPITTNVTWTAAGGPYVINADLNVNAGGTINIEAGASIFLGSGVDIIVATGGRILAEGTQNRPIRFTRAPGATTTWPGIDVNGAVGSAMSVFRHCIFERSSGYAIDVNAGSVEIDYCYFNPNCVDYLSLDGASFLVSNCIFPTPAVAGEVVHGTGGIRSDGRGIVRDCFFGHIFGYNDVFDFSGGNRPGPILQFVNNVCVGGDDDILDLDGTDTWVEGNIFMHVHRNNSPDSASAVSGGNDGGGGTGSRRVVTAIDTATEQLTCGTHGFTTGQEVVATAVRGDSFPAATPSLRNGSYFARAVSLTAVKLYQTSADAIADTNAIDFNGSIGTGVTLSLCRLDGISHITIVGNLFYDLDSAATAKEGNFYTFLNNTVVAQSNIGSEDVETGVLNFSDDGYHEAAGMYAEGNIIHSAFSLVRNYPGAGLQHTVTWNNNILPSGVTWTGLGSGNTSIDPQLVDIDIPTPGPTDYKWVANTIRERFSLGAHSPARGTGINGSDKGGARPLGVNISGAPSGTTNSTSATLVVGALWNGNFISNSAGAWPLGSGWTHYKWRMNGGAWSSETSIATPISLSSLSNGVYTIDVAGKNDAGYYQDDPAFGPSGTIASRTWTVDTAFVPPSPTPNIRINEVLASNTETENFGTVFPDIIELTNVGTAPADLSGWGLSDNAASPYKYTIPNGTTLAPGTFLKIYASGSGSVPAPKTGFALKQSGDDLTLTRAIAQGGGIVDIVAWGQQLNDFSIARGGDGTWTLGAPTFGAQNVPVALAKRENVVINEWLADAATLFANDFIELYNPSQLPVNIGGCYLTDNPAEFAGKHLIQPLTFIGNGSYLSFKADGDVSQGPDHVNFRLSPLQGEIGYVSPTFEVLDLVTYGSQSTDISQGRTPNGALSTAYFNQPTPGAPNTTTTTSTSVTVTTLMGNTHAWKYWASATTAPALDGANRDYNHPLYDDSAWAAASAQILHYETGTYPWGGLTKQTQLPTYTGTIRPYQTYYFRTSFNYSGPTSGVVFNASIIADDGCVITVNGNELPRIRMNLAAPTPVVYSTRAANGYNDGGIDTLTIPPSYIVQGENIVAVSVHQNNDQTVTTGTSSDIVWAMNLAAEVSTASTTNAVVINEVLPINLSHQNPDGSFAAWIELHNRTGNAVNLADYSLTDEVGNPRKFVVPAGVTIAANSYLSIACNPLSPASATNTGFALNGSGDQVYLFNTLANGGGLVDAVAFGQQIPDFSVARNPDASGPFALGVPTRAALNTAAATAQATSVRINEWLTNPLPGSPTWLELFNTAPEPVLLSGNYLTDSFGNKTKHLVPPLSFLGGSGTSRWLQLIADNDNSATINHVNFSIEPGEGLWLFSGNSVQLDGVATSARPQNVSEGRYTDGSATIVALSPTPNAENVAYNPDSDGDGMPDSYETANGLNPGNANDASLDADGDGQSNKSEFLAGTNPQVPGSRLAATVTPTATNGQFAISFTAVAGKTYTVRFKNTLSDATWTTLQQIPAPSIDTLTTVMDTPGVPQRFYQVVTPQQP
jgi:hypothetical protein